MIKRLTQRVIPAIARIGSDPNDDDDIRLQKSLLVLSSVPFMLAGVIWGLMYILFKEPLAGAIPLSYSFISLISIIHFRQSHKYGIYRFSQLVLILLLPFFFDACPGRFHQR